MEKKFNICEKSKANTEEILKKLNEVQDRTQEEVNFLINRAIDSAEMEIALAPLMNVKDYEMSELAQIIKKYPDFKYYKKVIFEDYIQKETKLGEFKVIKVPVDDGVFAPIEEKKPHSQKRRKKVLLVSQKLDDCEIYVMASRLTERDILKKEKSANSTDDDGPIKEKVLLPDNNDEIIR